MSGTSSPHSGLTRRSFLKATGAAAGALGLAGAAGSRPPKPTPRQGNGWPIFAINSIA